MQTAQGAFGSALRLACACALTSCVSAAPLALVVLLGGGLMLAFGLLATLLLPFGADPPPLGFAVGIMLVGTSVLGTLFALLGVATLALVWSCFVLTPIAWFAHALPASAPRAALALELALLLGGGALAGLLFGLGGSAPAACMDCPCVQSGWALVLGCALGSAAGMGSSAVYALGLLCVDGARAGWRHLRRSPVAGG